MEVGDVVVGDDMAAAIEAHRCVGRELGRKDLTLDAVELLPELPAPSAQVIGIVAAEEPVVGDVEIARTGPVGPDAQIDVLESATLHRQAFRPGAELRARPDGDLGVAEGQAFEIVVVRRLDVEQIEIAAAIEDDIAVARRLDDDRLVGRAAGGQVVGAFYRRGGVDAAIAGVVFRVIAIGAGVHEDDVTRFHARPSRRHRVAAAAIVVIRAHQRVERSGFLRTFPADGIDMVDMAAGCGHRWRRASGGPVPASR